MFGLNCKELLQRNSRKIVSKPGCLLTFQTNFIIKDSNPYDQQTLAMKIKAGLMGPLPPRAGEPGPSRGELGPPRGGDKSRGAELANLPGENLPEHHFKKKYFNQVMPYNTINCTVYTLLL